MCRGKSSKLPYGKNSTGGHGKSSFFPETGRGIIHPEERERLTASDEGEWEEANLFDQKSAFHHGVALKKKDNLILKLFHKVERKVKFAPEKRQHFFPILLNILYLVVDTKTGRGFKFGILPPPADPDIRSLLCRHTHSRFPHKYAHAQGG